MITWELAEDAVTATEQDAVVPEPASVHVEAGVNVSVETEDEKDTDPVGGVVAPGAVFVMVAVRVTGCPTSAVPVDEAIEAEVERTLTVSVALALEDLWVELPG